MLTFIKLTDLDGSRVTINAARIATMEPRYNSGAPLPEDREFTAVEVAGVCVLNVRETVNDITSLILEAEADSQAGEVRRRAAAALSAFSPDAMRELRSVMDFVMRPPPVDPPPMPGFRITCPGCGVQTDPDNAYATLENVGHRADCPEAIAYGWPVGGRASSQAE